MAKGVVLVTGANGEIGQSLVKALAQRQGGSDLVTVDLTPLPDVLRPLVRLSHLGTVLDRTLLDRLATQHQIETVFHLAALLSARGESDPDLAHRVNVEGTLNVLRMAHQESARQGRSLRVLFPSSIAVYGLPSRDEASRGGAIRVREEEWNCPVTMYGCNKLYCEHLGRYFSFHARRALSRAPRLDFRAIRLPGLLSADTLPAGGTSDFGPEMIHAAARGVPYRCLVGPDTKIPFMAMPDAVRAVIELADADRMLLSSCVYNIGAFSLSAGEIAERVREAFQGAAVDFEPDAVRSKIIASWPEDVDDSRARSDWRWRPAYDWDRTFSDYLVPSVAARYASAG